MFLALSPSEPCEISPPQNTMKSQGAGEDEGEDGEYKLRDRCECGTTSTLNIEQTGIVAVIGG